MVILGQEGAEFSQGYTIEISGTIPVNAGVSSSSALVVAWLRFLIRIQLIRHSIMRRRQRFLMERPSLQNNCIKLAIIRNVKAHSIRILMKVNVQKS